MKRSRVPKALGLAVLALVVGMVAAPAGLAQTSVADADFSGYATATVNHIHALQTGTTRLADTELAFSGAAVASKGLSSQLVNEMGTVVQPARADKSTYARGSALEIGVATPVPDNANQVILAGKAEADAPPSSQLITREIGPVAVDPLFSASLLRGQAQARWVSGTCVLGADLSRGLGYAADAALVGTPNSPLLAADAPTPERRVSQSVSRTTLVAQQDRNGNVVGSNFGLMTETRMTIAPVTLFKGTPNQITIEFLGEWVLRAVATGLPGGAWVHYGPGATSPTAHVLRILQGTAPTTTLEVTLQQLLGTGGLVVPVPGVAEIAIGEDPRAIGGSATTSPTQAPDGTEASGAVDVVRVTLLKGGPVEALDLRLGHAEVKAKVPAGGIACPLPVTKTPDPASVGVGQQFRTTITITNPYDCELQNVTAQDAITTTGAARFRVDEVSDGGSFSGSNSSGTINWSLGTIGPHQSKTISVLLTATAGPGNINDTVTATGSCGVGSVTGGATVQASVSGAASASVPVASVLGERLLPRTGGPTAAFVGSALLMAAAAFGMRRASRRLREGADEA